MKRLSLLSVVLLIGYTAFCQSFYAARRIEKNLIATFGTGTSTYFGELANPGHYIDAKPNINVGIQGYLIHRVGIRAEATWFTLAGDDSKANDNGRKQRNLSFKSNNIEFSTIGSFNLFPDGDRYYRRPSFNVYGFAGIGLIYFNPTTQYNGEKVALQPLRTEGVSYSRIGLVVPYGIGFRLKISPEINLAIEGGYRKTFTDYLDDVSARKYPDPATLSSDLSRALSNRSGGTVNIRGNPSAKDGYMLVNAKIEYYLPWQFGNKRPGLIYKKNRKANYRYNKSGRLKHRRR